MKRVALLGLVMTVGVAHADKAASLEHYKKGRAAYASAQFDVAAAEFERAYAEHPSPEYLHDIGQAHRRLDKCTAIDFFERYLAAKPDATNKADVDKTIVALRERCAPAVAPSPPVATVVDTRETPAVSTHVVARDVAPSPLSFGASGGVVLLGAGPVDVPPLATIGLDVRYRVVDSTVEVDAGAGVALARLPFDDLSMGTAWLVRPHVGGEARYPIAHRISLVANAEVGALIMTGLDEGNPFTENAMASGAITTLSLQGDLGVAWAATDRLRVRLSPVGYQWSPRRSALASDIGSLHGFAMSAGISVGL